MLATTSLQRHNAKGYSAFQHAVDGLFLKPEDLMLIVRPDPLSLYCDASGNEREPLTVVGSSIATVQEWLEFEPKWKAVLSKYDLEYFRASELASSSGQFASGWRDNNRAEMLCHGSFSK